MLRTIILFIFILFCNRLIAAPPNDGITTLTGQGLDITTYISDKVAQAGNGDVIRLNYYILEHRSTTSFFYNALKGALANGAQLEIITEARNRNPDDSSPARVRDQTEFLFGDGTGPLGILNEPVGAGGAITIYECEYGCDSPIVQGTVINHNKIALLDISGERDIIVSSANLREGGLNKWQVGIDLDGNDYDSQWLWWNSVFDSDICFASGGINCESLVIDGNGGFESNHEDSTVSYLPGPTPSYNAPVEWMNRMGYKRGCSLKVMMGSWGNNDTGRAFLDAMANIAAVGCDVIFIHGETDKEIDIINYVNGRFDVEYNHSVHAKMILWNGLYNGSNKKMSWVGSMNATNNAIRNNDESMIRVEDKNAYNSYNDFFEDVLASH